MHNIAFTHDALLVKRVEVLDDLRLDPRFFFHREVAAQAVGRGAAPRGKVGTGGAGGRGGGRSVQVGR